MSKTVAGTLVFMVALVAPAVVGNGVMPDVIRAALRQ
jgi:hypothetical protein